MILLGYEIAFAEKMDLYCNPWYSNTAISVNNALQEILAFWVTPAPSTVLNTIPGIGEITTSVGLRANPVISDQAKVILRSGTSVLVIEEEYSDNHEWYKIECHSDETGYILKRCIQLDSE